MSNLSYSMIYDKVKNREPYVYVDNRKIYKWVDDSVVTNCNNCNILFTFYYRKHHCRLCGRIFCYNCSSKRIEIPIELQIKPEYNENIVQKPFINWNYMETTKDKMRICDKCYIKVIELIRLKK